MKRPSCVCALVCALVWASMALLCSAQNRTLPPGFLDGAVAGPWNQPVGVAFARDGRMFVWEKAGVVWLVENGVKSSQPLLDLSDEVGNWSSKGMKGFALDPDFLQNGSLYLLYDVDRYHLLYAGTPQYDPGANLYNEATIARITRYTARSSDGFHSVDPTSRKVLVGESASTGFPILDNHESGTLQFGNDGTLLASCGDGAAADGTDHPQQALADGILQPKEDVGNYRAQLLDSLDGKIIRIDPRTGDGLPDNPYFDPARPRSARSRVWVYGLRNPFSFKVVPAFASTRWPLPRTSWKQGPGVLIIGDVGAQDWEEINIAYRGGENFGWPAYEGMDVQPTHYPRLLQNLDAPNPLYNQVVGGTLCTQQYFYFQDLLTQETLQTPVFGNPCDPAQPVPASVFPSMHVRPIVDWGHPGPSRAKAFDSQGNAVHYDLGTPGAPVLGTQFLGNCSVAGVWYTGTSFPQEYQNTCFHADYTGGWIQQLLFSSRGELLEVKPFATGMGPLVSLAMEPVSGDLYYVHIEPSEIRRVTYFAGNVPPTAVASATPTYGAEPLSVRFDGKKSSDPEHRPLQYQWDFGNGTPASRLADPVRWFPAEDPSLEGTLRSSVRDELFPPQASGPGSDPEVLRDGVYPDVFALLNTQYTTFYTQFDHKNGVDWIGYEFDSPHDVHGLVFQEGGIFGPLGGWFEDLRVQFLPAPAPQVQQSWKPAVWTDVPGALFLPAYRGNDGTGFDVYEITFPPVHASAVRLIGTPGGDWEFVSAAELRVLASPAPYAFEGPRRHDVTLTVLDDAFVGTNAQVPVWTSDTPPQVEIESPWNGGSYDSHQASTVPMTAAVADREQDAGSLSCEWRVSLHHEDHIHPEPVDPHCTTSFTILPHDEGPGEVLYYEFKLTVIDSLGLATTRSSFLVPRADCNLNGSDDLQDLSLGTSVDADGNGIPDECDTDCNGDGVADVVGISQDCNGNGVPDECDLASGFSLDRNHDGVPDECGLRLGDRPKH